MFSITAPQESVGCDSSSNINTLDSMFFVRMASELPTSVAMEIALRPTDYDLSTELQFAYSDAEHSIAKQIDHDLKDFMRENGEFVLAGEAVWSAIQNRPATTLEIFAEESCGLREITAAFVGARLQISGNVITMSRLGSITVKFITTGLDLEDTIAGFGMSHLRCYYSRGRITMRHDAIVAWCLRKTALTHTTSQESIDVAMSYGLDVATNGCKIKLPGVKRCKGDCDFCDDGKKVDECPLWQIERSILFPQCTRVVDCIDVTDAVFNNDVLIVSDSDNDVCIGDVDKAHNRLIDIARRFGLVPPNIADIQGVVGVTFNLIRQGNHLAFAVLA